MYVRGVAGSTIGMCGVLTGLSLSSVGHTWGAGPGPAHVDTLTLATCLF